MMESGRPLLKTWILVASGTFRSLRNDRPPAYAGRMELTDDDIRAFADIWETQFGEKLTADQARTEAQRLLEFYAALAEPLPAEEEDASQ